MGSWTSQTGSLNFGKTSLPSEARAETPERHILIDSAERNRVIKE